MKSLQSFVFSAAVAAVMTSCGTETSEKIEERADTVASKIEAAVEVAGNRIDSLNKPDAGDDASFVRSAFEANKKELSMLADGHKMATSKEVKAAAAKMKADHEKLGSNLKAYAAQKSIKLDQGEEHMEDMNRERGTDWDRRWVNGMVDDHEKDIKDYEDARDDVADPTLKAMIEETIPVLRAHLETSKVLQAKMSK